MIIRTIGEIYHKQLETVTEPLGAATTKINFSLNLHFDDISVDLLNMAKLASFVADVDHAPHCVGRNPASSECSKLVRGCEAFGVVKPRKGVDSSFTPKP